MPEVLPATDWAAERWQALWRRMASGYDGSADYFTLRRAYDEPHRAYHTFAHIAACLRWYDAAVEAGAAARNDLLELAIWFHDAIYDPHRSDNEARSARWWQKLANKAGVAAGEVAQVADWIMLTRHVDTPVDPLAALLIDIDLAILGSDADVFAEFERQVRQEYRWVPGLIYRRKRREVLASFLARPRVYGTDYFEARLGRQAMLNLAQAIAALGG